MQNQLAEGEPARDGEPLRRLARERGPDGEERAGRGGGTEDREKFVDRLPERKPGGGPCDTRDDRDDHRVPHEAEAYGPQRFDADAALARAGDENHDERGEDDEIGRQHHEQRPGGGGAEQQDEHRDAEKADVADDGALRLDRRFRHGQAAEDADGGGDEIDRAAAPEVGGDEPQVEHFRQRQVRGEVEEHRRQGEVEDELGEIGRRFGREEAAPPRAITQPDEGEERQGLEEDREHCERLAVAPAPVQNHACPGSRRGVRCPGSC